MYVLFEKALLLFGIFFLQLIVFHTEKGRHGIVRNLFQITINQIQSISYLDIFNCLSRETVGIFSFFSLVDTEKHFYNIIYDSHLTSYKPEQYSLVLKTLRNWMEILYAFQ